MSIRSRTANTANVQFAANTLRGSFRSLRLSSSRNNRPWIFIRDPLTVSPSDTAAQPLSQLAIDVACLKATRLRLLKLTHQPNLRSLSYEVSQRLAWCIYICKSWESEFSLISNMVFAFCDKKDSGQWHLRCRKRMVSRAPMRILVLCLALCKEHPPNMEHLLQSHARLM